jgi:hypothetical protein
MSTVSHETLLALRDFFVAHFSGDDLTDLALELGIDLEDIPGTTRKAKARELAGYLNRHGLIDELREVVPRVRPKLTSEWATVFGDQSAPALSPPAGVPGPELNPVVSVVAEHPDFAAAVDRKNMLFAAGVLSYAAGIDLTGSGRAVSLRVLSQLNSVSGVADGHTPLGDFLRYFISLPEALPHKQMIEDLIAKYSL